MVSASCRFRVQMQAFRLRPPLLAAFALLCTGTFSHLRHLAPEAPRMSLPTYVGTFSHLRPLAGDVIAPPLLRDAEPWPAGMVIAPPETHDRIALASPTGDVWLSGLLGRLTQALLAPAPALL